jgi:hypothetical protein
MVKCAEECWFPHKQPHFKGTDKKTVKQLGHDNFTHSNWQVDCFKNRNNIAYIKVNGENMSAN